MNELIIVDIDSQTVSARELHEKLKVGTAFKDWFPRMCEYGFVEGTDFNMLKNERVQLEGNREVTRIVNDAYITIDMAKEICMIQRTPEGKKIREYFIDLEKAWNTPEQIFARALMMADKTIASLKENVVEKENRIAQMKPKEIFADAVATSHTSILVGDLAKIISQNGYEIGQKRLFNWLRKNGYLMKCGESRNLPKQKYIDQGLFQIRENTIGNPDGSVRVTKTTKVTGKGQVYFVNKFLYKVNQAHVEEV